MTFTAFSKSGYLLIMIALQTAAHPQSSTGIEPNVQSAWAEGLDTKLDTLSRREK